ncbi:MAG: DNA repair protein RadA [Ignavibacteriae bacterium]|nr:DNA repair protein RadA [Ignavibacteriota bacterium]MCB9209549.1 DNA repair protein RadA [Ignavibacteriales bacterium]MCB9258192.1 DNA repair protein RadA [Ignavibacteriales bacterium]
MSKQKIKYICSQCGFESLRWLGKCPECNEWNTFSEEFVEVKTKSKKQKVKDENIFQLSEVNENDDIRIKTGILEFDRVLGGGLIVGSVVLIGGDPGIGKSTLVMQAASSMKAKILYVTGEESVRQINLRAKRLKVKQSDIFLLSETDLDIVTSAIDKVKPDVVIIDSIQTMQKPEYENAPGTVTQIRESTNYLMQLAKTLNFSVILIGHVTKEGYIAGPKVLEHIVDTVLQFEGEKNYSYRILRAQKNRFGNTNEIGIFEMHEDGLTEVKNPSQIFLSERNENVTGAVVTASIEGSRPVLLEVQALVTPTNFGNPQRVTTGFDYRRLSILLAVLEKRAGLRLSAHNVFLNIAGGIKIDEPAIDLAVCTAVASSLKNQSTKSNYVVLGEVGLGGEIRSVGHIEKRIQEAEKLGFNNVIIPANNMKSLKSKNNIKLISVVNIAEAINKILE